MCVFLVFALHTLCPPFIILIVLVLSCMTTFLLPRSLNRCSVGYSSTWSLQYRLGHSTNAIALLTPISSDSVKLFEFTFYPDDPDIGDSVPRVKQYPVRLFMSMWTANEASILHTMFSEPSNSIISGR